VKCAHNLYDYDARCGQSRRPIHSEPVPNNVGYASDHSRQEPELTLAKRIVIRSPRPTRFQLPRFRYKHCKYVGRRFRGILHNRPLEYQVERDLLVLSGMRAFPLDPSLHGAKLGSKAGFDLTIPFASR
jgi:hypothetical protein